MGQGVGQEGGARGVRQGGGVRRGQGGWNLYFDEVFNKSTLTLVY